MPPKRFEGKFGIPPSHPVDSLLTQALYRLPESMNFEHIEKLANDIATKVNTAREQSGISEPLTPEETQILYLKLARHYEDNGESAVIDIPTCVDALVESPRFLNSDKGSIEKLFELHEMKTLQKIAELRRKRAEITERGEGGFNPYENLFETKDGEYYLARLLNMPHLEEESEYMDHCVGTSTSYVNKMKRGEVEIFSFRNTQTHEPVVTIEYDTRSHRLLQVKTESDGAPSLLDDTYASNLAEAIEELGDTVNDAGEKRIIESKEAEHMRQLLTLSEKNKRNEQLVRDELLFLYEINEPIQCFDGGRDPLIKELRDIRDTNDDLPTLFECAPTDIAHSVSEIKPTTKAYIGKLELGIFDALPDTVENVYTKFPEERVKFRGVELGTGIKDGHAFQKAIENQGMQVYEYAARVLESPSFKVVAGERNVDVVEVSVASLGFNAFTRYDKICARAKELGLELCPTEVGPQLRLQYRDQPPNEYLIVAMDAIILSDGNPHVFVVARSVGGLWLGTSDGGPGNEWSLDARFAFLSPR